MSQLDIIVGFILAFNTKHKVFITSCAVSYINTGHLKLNNVLMRTGFES